MKKKFENKNKLFFVSDTHFFHTNIIKYCNRPFSSVREMNEALVENWNAIVPEDGIVFHAGDVSMGANERDLQKLLKSLNGTIYLIKGNHERDALATDFIKSRWAGVSDRMEIFVKDDEITYDEQHIVIDHYPGIAWNGSHRGSWQLFGHVHGGLSNKGEIKHGPAQMDIGVDCHNYFPISYERVKEIITKQHLSK